MSFQNNFTPASQTITNITKANPGVVTTASATGYLNGLFVRIVLPKSAGMQQLNEQLCQITVLTSNTFSIGVNTSNFDSFNGSTASQVPQVITVGEVTSTLLNATKNSRNIIPET